MITFAHFSCVTVKKLKLVGPFIHGAAVSNQQLCPRLKRHLIHWLPAGVGFLCGHLLSSLSHINNISSQENSQRHVHFLPLCAKWERF